MQRAELIDELMDTYVDWREQCMALRNAYERWSNGPTADRKLAFEAFKAALDLEEHASLVYADRLHQVDRDLAQTQQVTVEREAA